MSLPSQCDYLVIGGGAAGCIIARRLAQQPGIRVILVEAGKPDEGDPRATDLSRLDEQGGGYDTRDLIAGPTGDARLDQKELDCIYFCTV